MRKMPAAIRDNGYYCPTCPLPEYRDCPDDCPGPRRYDEGEDHELDHDSGL